MFIVVHILDIENCNHSYNSPKITTRLFSSLNGATEHVAKVIEEMEVSIIDTFKEITTYSSKTGRIGKFVIEETTVMRFLNNI